MKRITEQHFVPRTYLKAWETQVETIKEPNKKFQGVYVFDDSDIGNGANIKSILWEPHLYTIRYSDRICEYCPLVKKEFVSRIYDLLMTGYSKTIYGKIGYSIIKTKRSIHKHLSQLNDWEFYYDNDDLAKRTAILNRIHDFRSYILERSFDAYFENDWEKIYNSFINAVQEGQLFAPGRSERIIPEKIAVEMISSFLIMFCRNPLFDSSGIYAEIRNNLLYPLFSSKLQTSEEELQPGEEIPDEKELADDMMKEMWHIELYRIFHGYNRGYYHYAMINALKSIQMVLFEADDECYFITSDNPAFSNHCAVEVEDTRVNVFPLSPKHLLCFAKGSEGVNVVDYRLANKKRVRYFNRIIQQNKNKIVISKAKNLCDVL